MRLELGRGHPVRSGGLDGGREVNGVPPHLGER